MTDPFYTARPGDPITADDWNNMQRKLREEVRSHTHKGADAGTLLDGEGISPTARLKVSQVEASVSLKVQNVDVLERLSTLDKQKLPLTGGALAGALSVNGNVGVGVAEPNARLELRGATNDGSASALKVTNAAGNSLLELKNDGSLSLADKALYLRSGDLNHGITLDRGVDGPRVFGFSGGQLASTADNKVALQWSRGNVTVQGDLLAGNSALYFTQTEHLYSNFGDTPGYAAIQNSKDHDALMLLGRQTSKGRVVKLWDRLEVVGDQQVNGTLNVLGPIRLEGPRLQSKTGRGIVQTDATDEWLRVNPDTHYKSMALYGAVAVGEGGLAVGEWSLQPKGQLRVTGAIVPSVGNAPDKGIQFPADPGGGSGDQAFIRYYVTSGETTKLLMGTENDPEDSIGLWQYGAERLTVFNGNIGISTTTPKSKLDVQTEARTGTHPANRALYVTSGFGEADGVEFRHSNGTQGIGIGYNTIYATGANDNQDLNLQARGTGTVRARVNGNQMQLERTSAQGGKALFLELYQSPAAGADVFPCLRFHHGNHHWSRLEASNGRIHIKQGDLNVDDYIDVAARNVYITSQGQDAVATSCPEAVRILRGTVTANGAIAAGAGFSVSYADPAVAGVYDITFSRGFKATPTVVVTQQFGGGMGGDTRDNAVVVSADAGRVRIKVGDATGVARNRDFHFIAIGP